MPKTILLTATDFSETSDLALTAARAYAHRLAGDCELHAVHVMEPVVGPSVLEPFILASASPVLGQPFANAQAKLNALCDAPGGPPMTPHVRIGAPTTEIVALARQLGADVLVVGTAGRRGIERLVLGSVAEHVVRAAPCTVLVTRPKEVVVTPTIEPPCPDCVAARASSSGAQVWCERHSMHHSRAHTYRDRNDAALGDPGLPIA